MQRAFFRNKRLVIALIFAAAIAVIFWSLSRVPALNEKAQMGLRSNFSAIAFDILLPVAGDEPIYVRVLKTTVNWLYTNWKGMTFGLLFAAAVLTILGSITQRSFRTPWLNTLSGMFLGAPLGVCVNCATPIAQGMYSAGARLETALSTLVSSPTLNAIVLSMAFTLLPWEMALSNVAAVLLLLASLPLLVEKFASANRLVDATAGGDLRHYAHAGALPDSVPIVADESYANAFAAAALNYLRNLLYICRLAMPLMLLAGVLGAAAIETVPFARLPEFAATPLILFAAAVLATFLPVPMAFNVIVVMALLSNGVDPGIAAVLLFALAAYSIYPATIIARYISPRLSAALAGTVVLIATVLGLANAAYFDHKSATNESAISAGLTEAGRDAYRRATSICGSLPEQLHDDCFTAQIKSFRNILPATDLCANRPSSVAVATCQETVEFLSAEAAAIASSHRDPCLTLSTDAARSRCTLSFVFRMALNEHDVNYCDVLGNGQAAAQCRTQYLNASLLFNPDDSVCVGLRGSELSDCKVNAQIYRLADTLDLEGCEQLPTDAREHCRFVIATNMVGRSNDTRGCASLLSDSLRARCVEHALAWQATHSASLEMCAELQNADLQSSCQLRVANRKIEAILSDYSLSMSQRSGVSSPDAMPAVALDAATVSAAPPLDWQSLLENEKTSISYVEHQVATASTRAASGFSRHTAAELGISSAWDFRVSDFFEPFIIGKGIASGDFNRDTWPDLVLASEHGALLYQNTGGKFQLLDVDQGILGTANLFLVALLDADGDGNQDLFASAYGGNNFILLNKRDNFRETELLHLEGNHRLTLSAGFADIDRDGDIDIVLGNWSSGIEKLFAPEFSANAILFREKGSYRAVEMHDVIGETNSVLVADANDDGFPDLLFGNDRPVPDIYYFGAADLKFRSISRSAGIVPLTSMFTMSLELADFNNDLKPDIFSTDMTFARSGRDSYCDAIADDGARLRCDEIVEAYDIFSSGNATKCSDLESAIDARDCYIAFSIKAAKSLKDSSYCEQLPDRSSPLFSLCQHIAAPIPPEHSINQERHLQQKQRNVLLLGNGDGFLERGVEFGVDSSFWSWNAKAADLDNDGWQDIFVGNGFHFGDSFYEVQPNVLFRNLEGRGFENSAAEWGIDDTINTPSYTYVDYDLDGDLDVVATGVAAPPRIYRNEVSENHSVTFVLRQETLNKDGIGTKLTIEYGNGSAQRKELKMSGGFLSFDNPAVHFGIGEHKVIDRVSIVWPDGVMQDLPPALPADRTYKIIRKTAL